MHVSICRMESVSSGFLFCFLVFGYGRRNLDVAAEQSRVMFVGFSEDPDMTRVGPTD